MARLTVEEDDIGVLKSPCDAVRPIAIADAKHANALGRDATLLE
jgi:hypothetical protein